jgi:Mrp family chromosome partitioning ATPase
VLRGECSLEDAIVMDWGDRLFVLPAGVAKGNSPSHLFSGPRFFEILSQLRTQFDKVIIDVAPVLCASETLMIAKQADGVLLCARQVRQAHAKLSAAGVNIVGAVLNGAPTRKYSYYYRGYATV